MKILSLQLHDFRCFEEFMIEFGTEFNVHVLLAENMAGKSALIHGLKVLLRPFLLGIIPNEGVGLRKSDHRVIGPNPMSDVSLSCGGEIRVQFEPSRQKNHRALITKYKVFEAQLSQEDPQFSGWEILRSSPKSGQSLTKSTEGEHPRAVARSLYESVSEQGEGALPLLAFIGTEYIAVPNLKSNVRLEGRITDGYLDCFSNTSFRDRLFDWLEKNDGILGEQTRKPLIAEAYGDQPKNALTVFFQAVKTLLPKIKRIEWSREATQPVVEIEGEGIRFFNMLSDGYRYLILLAGELSTRAFWLNKHLGENVLKETPGVVLIDEFGIHLHPSLQSDTLQNLSKAFPKIQFIVSTHSPLLINGLKKEQIHLLEVDVMGNRSTRHPDEDAIGQGAEGLLIHIFGLSTTYDRSVLVSKDRYSQLFKQKTNSALNDLETEEFRELSQKLAPLRLDPSLQIVEEDALTRMVRENMAKRQQNKVAPTTDEIFSETEIDTILDDIFPPR